MLNTDDVSAKLIELEDRSRRNKTDLEEIDRCQRKGPRKQKQAKIGTDHALLFADLTDLKISNVF